VRKIHVFLNENSTNCDNSQASKGKADDAIAHSKTRSGKDRLNPQIQLLVLGYAGCNLRPCKRREAQSASGHVHCMGHLSLDVPTIIEGLSPLDGEDRISRK
jgi:hypothetical protein